MHVDFVVNIFQFKKNPSYAENEIKTLVEESKKYGSKVKVILEVCYLSDDEKIKLCSLAEKYGADYPKTSTGYGIAGAALSDVQLMKRHFSGKIKVSGGIKSFNDCRPFLDLEIDKIGSSNSVKIMQGADPLFLALHNLGMARFAGMIEHTNISPYTAQEEILQTVSEAQQFGFGSVVVRPDYFKLVKERVSGTAIQPAIVVGFSNLLRKDSSNGNLEVYDVPLAKKLEELLNLV